MSDTDIAAAARRVAAKVREDGLFYMRDLLALLPILDAVAAGQDDSDRVERWARELCRISGFDPDAICRDAGDDSGPEWTFYRDDARSTIALADADAAGRVAELRIAAARARYLLDIRADPNDTAGHVAVAELDRCLAAAPHPGTFDGLAAAVRAEGEGVGHGG